MSTMFRFVLFLLLFLSASQTWGVSVSAHQYDVKSVIFAVDAYVYDAPLNLRTCDNQCIESKAQDVNKGHFLAFVSDFLATKSVRGLETRGVRPASGTRTIQGQVDAATQAGNPTVQRGGQDLFRLRSSEHGQGGATATPQNVRNVTPDGKVFIGRGSDRAVTPRDIRELYKAQTGQGTSSIRTRSGR